MAKHKMGSHYNLDLLHLFPQPEYGEPPPDAAAGPDHGLHPLSASRGQEEGARRKVRPLLLQVSKVAKQVFYDQW